jgi:hypothetical protein
MARGVSPGEEHVASSVTQQLQQAADLALARHNLKRRRFALQREMQFFVRK